MKNSYSSKDTVNINEKNKPQSGTIYMQKMYMTKDLYTAYIKNSYNLIIRLQKSNTKKEQGVQSELNRLFIKLAIGMPNKHVKNILRISSHYGNVN